MAPTEEDEDELGTTNLKKIANFFSICAVRDRPP